MARKSNVKKGALNHSPAWFHERCKAENGGNQMYRSQFNADMVTIEAPDDRTLNYFERLDIYEEAWNAILAGEKGNVDAAQLCEVLEQEGLLGNPADFFSQEPFPKIGRLIEKHDLSHDTIREFLKWRAKQVNIAKARKAKGKGRKKKPTAVELADAQWKKFLPRKDTSDVNSLCR